MRWVVEQHALLYQREYGFNHEFETLVAGIAADFLAKFEPQWERGWIAELPTAAGLQRVGSAFVVRHSPTVAQLRMLIVTPAARGLGLGAALTDECLAFARNRSGPGGYQRMMLWSNACLSAARAIYAARGFRICASQAYQGFGQDLVSETWELVL